MAPSVQTQTLKQNFDTRYKEGAATSFKDFGRLKVDSKYPDYLPRWDKSLNYPPLEDFEHVDRGLQADPEVKALLDGAKVSHITPKAGSEIVGKQLSQLSTKELDELARYVAERKVLVFRDQDFQDIGKQRQIDIAKYFGRLHIHHSSGTAADTPEMHVVHVAKEEKQGDPLLLTNTTTTSWHSDVSYERQPPGVTFLWLMETPSSGGDTLYADTVTAFQRLSPAMQEFLEGLEALHSGIEQVETARARGAHIRRDGVVTRHPLVRRHPVTGEKALYVNDQFTRSIVGLKREESDVLLRFLSDHIKNCVDLHVRARWQPNTVVIWDNRVTQHTAIGDFDGKETRHGARLTSQAERPISAKTGSKLD